MCVRVCVWACVPSFRFSVAGICFAISFYPHTKNFFVCFLLARWAFQILCVSNHSAVTKTTVKMTHLILKKKKRLLNFWLFNWCHGCVHWRIIAVVTTLGMFWRYTKDHVAGSRFIWDFWSCMTITNRCYCRLNGLYLFCEFDVEYHLMWHKYYLKYLLC